MFTSFISAFKKNIKKSAKIFSIPDVNSVYSITYYEFNFEILKKNHYIYITIPMLNHKPMIKFSWIILVFICLMLVNTAYSQYEEGDTVLAKTEQKNK